MRPVDATEDNRWHPFEDRLAFDWAVHHFVELQSSEAQINHGLDMWLASTIKSGSKDGIPWRSAKELYATIDAVQQGSAPWKTYKFRYTGPMPCTPPKWMLETYELCARDSRQVLHEQLLTTDFDGKFNYTPYRQFNGKGDRVWSNLMSADWAWRQAVRLFSSHIMISSNTF
jgi:Plavaka transposase